MYPMLQTASWMSPTTFRQANRSLQYISLPVRGRFDGSGPSDPSPVTEQQPDRHRHAPGIRCQLFHWESRICTVANRLGPQGLAGNWITGSDCTAQKWGCGLALISSAGLIFTVQHPRRPDIFSLTHRMRNCHLAAAQRRTAGDAQQSLIKQLLALNSSKLQEQLNDKDRPPFIQ